MYQRPKVTETEDDLLQQEEEFFKASGRQPPSKTKSENKNIKTHEKLPREIVGDIIEKNQCSLEIQNVSIEPAEGFPKPFQVDLAVKNGKKSLFSLHMEKIKKQPAKNERSTEPDPMDIVADNQSIPNVSQSFVITGPEADNIHDENMKILCQMSEKEILEEQKKLKETIDPNLLKFLESKRRNKNESEKKIKKNLENMNDNHNLKIKKKQHENDNSGTTLLDSGDNLNVDLQIKEKLTKYVDEKWINIDFVEKEKLEWIGDIPDAKTLEPNQSYSARFDFKGELQPFSADIDVTKSLHHHGDEPERPGYTIQELYQLSRSSVLQQRNLALNTLANIIHKTKLGYYDICFNGALLHMLVESDLFFLLRFSIDENSLIPATINCLKRLLCSDTDEFALDKLLGVTDLDEQPLLHVKMETNTDEEKELKDHVLINCDLIRGVLRTDLLVRLSYILNHLNPNRKTVISIIVVLIRIARHSLEAAQELMKIPNLLFNIHRWVRSDDPIHQGLKLFRILICHSRECAQEINRNFSMDFLISYVDVEIISTLSRSEFYFLQLESVYLLKSLLHYDLMVDDFMSWTPCFLRLLQEFFFEKVDINDGTDFYFELFAAISSLLVTCIRKKLSLDPNIMKKMKTCLEKWLKQLMQLNEYNFAGSKAIGSLLRFFIAYFEVYGVDKTDVEFIKKINSILISLICSKVFDTMTLNLLTNSHVLAFQKINRDPKNLPSLDSIYEGGDDYLKIIRNSSALPFLISLTVYLKSSYNISHECVSAMELLTDSPNLRKYVAKILNYDVKEWNWFMNFEEKFLVNLLDLLLIKEDKNVLQLACKLLSLARIDNNNSKKILSIICNNKTWNSVDSDFFEQLYRLYSKVYLKISFEKSVMIDYKSEIIPKDWIYKAILLIRETEDINNVKNILRFISIVLEENPTLLDRTSYTLRYYYLCMVFLTDSNVCDPEIQKYLKIGFEDIISNRLKINLNKKVNEKKSFYDLYTELLTQYAGLSYGEPVFAQFVLFPLQNRFDISFRKLVWSEYLYVLRVVTVGYPVPSFIDITEFIQPCETDESLLVTYFNSVRNKVILKTRNPFIYAIAVNNVKNYMRSNVTNQKLFNCLKNSIDNLPDKELKAYFVN